MRPWQSKFRCIYSAFKKLGILAIYEVKWGHFKKDYITASQKKYTHQPLYDMKKDYFEQRLHALKVLESCFLSILQRCNGLGLSKEQLFIIIAQEAAEL